MSQFIEMFKHKKPNGKIADLVDANIKSVKKSFNKEGMIEYIDISSVNAKYRTLNETTQYIVASAPSRAQQCVQNGDILVSTVRPINRNVAVVNSNLTSLVASTGFCVLRPIDGYREYLLAIVTSDKYTEKMCDIASGGLYPAVNNSDVLSYDIFIPDKDFLHRVTQIYQQADKSGFDGFKSQFIEMFKCSAERVALSSLCDTFIDGDWIEAKDQSDSGIRLIQTGNVGVGTFKDKGDKARYISEDTFNRLNCTEVVEGDILISRLPDPVGRACIIPAELGKSITAVDCTIIRLNDKVLPKFFVAFTSTPDYAMQIKKVLSGTTRLRVSRANLGKIQVPLPSVDKQQQFVTIAEQADKSGSVGLKSGLNFAKLLIHR